MLDLSNPSKRLAFAVLAVVCAAFLFFPVYWMANTALKPLSEAFLTSPTFYPHGLTFANFTGAFRQSSLGRSLINSLIAAGGGATVSTILAAYAGYGMAMFRFPGSRALMYLFLAGQMFPFALILVSLYPMFEDWGLTNSYFGLMLAYVILSLPASVYIMHSQFSRLPIGVVEAARVDGAGELRVFHSVVLRVTLPAVIAVWLFAFMWGWNDLLFSLTLITSPHLRMLGPGLLAIYLGQFRDNWGGIMAASLLASLPIVVLFACLQRYFVRGLTAGAVKG